MLSKGEFIRTHTFPQLMTVHRKVDVRMTVSIKHPIYLVKKEEPKMGKTTKRMSQLFAVLMALAILLSGCGTAAPATSAAPSSSAPAKSSEAAAASSEAAPAPESSLEPVELNAWFLAPQVKDVELVQAEVSKLLSEKINATIKLNYFWWDSYADKQKLALASGEAIDTMFSPQWWNYETYVSQKAYLELDDLLANYGKNIVANIHPSYLEAPRIEGVLYGIPTNKDMLGVSGVLVNKAMAEKYNMDFSGVKTPADLEPFLKTIKENESDVVPFISTKGDQSSYFMMDYSASINGDVGFIKTDGDIKVLNTKETEEYKTVQALARDWFKKGYINEDVATLQDGMPVKKAQKAFMWAEQLKPGKDKEMEAQLGYEIVQVYAYQGLPRYTMTGDLTNSMFVIPRASKNPERAMMFLDLMFYDKQLKNLISWGIEGVHYKKVGENQIDFADGVTAENSGYTGMAQWAQGGNQFLDYLWANESPDKWEKMKEFNDSAVPTKALGWTFNQEPVKTQIAACTTVGDEFGAALNSGVVDYDEVYPKMQKAYETAGINDIIAEAQKQLDAFAAK